MNPFDQIDVKKLVRYVKPLLYRYIFGIIFKKKFSSFASVQRVILSKSAHLNPSQPGLTSGPPRAAAEQTHNTGSEAELQLPVSVPLMRNNGATLPPFQKAAI